MPELLQLTPDDMVERVVAAHERERTCLRGLSEAQVRAASALPGWSRGHVLAARLAFLQAAARQIDHVLGGRSIEFYDGGKPGREAEVEANAGRPGTELLHEVEKARSALDAAWSRVGPGDWERQVAYREGGPMSKLALASWREAELHLVDFDLGVVPSAWSREFCLHLFDFLSPRVPEGVRLDLLTPGGEEWRLGEGVPLRVTGSPTDLAAWLAGRPPEAPVVSGTGTLPPLRRLRDSRQAGGSA